MYHMIRRQILRSLRKPLIVMTPKSLLRHEMSVSSLEDLANGEFATVIDEIDTAVNAASVHRVVLSSGKVYFDLLKARRADQQHRRRAGARRAALSIPGAGDWKPCSRSIRTRAKWCGARKSRRTRARGTRSAIGWRRWCGKRELLYAGRPPAAAPATGISKIHEMEQRGLIEAALTATNKEDGARETKRLMASTPGTPPAAAAATSR